MASHPDSYRGLRLAAATYSRLIVLGKPGGGKCSDGVGAGGTRQLGLV